MIRRIEGADASASACCRPIESAPPSALVDSEFLVPGVRDAENELSSAEQAVGSRKAAAPPSAPSIVVDSRTTAPHGITGDELRRFSGALHLMKGQARRRGGELWLLSTDKGGLPRSTISDIQKRVGRYQRDADLLAYYVRVMETRPNAHAHIVFSGTADIAARLKKAKFGYLIDVRPVTDPDGLSKKYLAKERTPQAGYKHGDLGGRLKGVSQARGRRRSGCPLA